MKKLLPLLSLFCVQNLAAQILDSAVAGDVNGDGKMSVADIVTLVNQLETPPTNLSYWQATNGNQIVLTHSNNKPSQRYIYCADVNLDGNVDQDDLFWQAQTVIGEVGDVEIDADNGDLYCEFDDQPEEIPGWAEGHGFVDMGLPSGLLWASCNIGASSPEEYGDYFAWGETSTKSYYYWDGTEKYNWGTSDRITKYNNSDGETELESADDAARQIWKGNWRMPSKQEMQELKDECIWVWSKQKDVWGYTIISRTTQNHIFLPAGGYKYMDGTYGEELRNGYYWTKTLGDQSPSGASSLFIGFIDHSQNLGNRIDLVNYFRSWGLTIRPVCTRP